MPSFLFGQPSLLESSFAWIAVQGIDHMVPKFLLSDQSTWTTGIKLKFLRWNQGATNGSKISSKKNKLTKSITGVKSWFSTKENQNSWSSLEQGHLRKRKRMSLKLLPKKRKKNLLLKNPPRSKKNLFNSKSFKVNHRK